MDKKIMICLLGERPQVVYTAIKLMEDQGKEMPDELWLLGTDHQELENESTFNDNMNDLYADLQNRKIVWRRFRIKNTDQVDNVNQNERIAEGIMRSLLLAYEMAGNDGQVWLSLAGGRKTMSSYGHMGQFFVNISQIMHVIATGEMEQQTSLEDVINNWDKLKKHCSLIPLPSFVDWHILIRKFFLGLGKELCYDSYPLSRKEAPAPNTPHDYTIPDGTSLLNDFTKISESLKSFLGLAGGVSFNAFRHDLGDFLHAIAKNPSLEERKEWVNLLCTYSLGIEKLGKALDGKEGSFSSDSGTKEALEKILWLTIFRVTALLKQSLPRNKKNKWKFSALSEEIDDGKWSCLFPKNDRQIKDHNICFSVHVDEDATRMLANRHLLVVLRNMVMNMLCHGQKELCIDIRLSAQGLKVTSRNRVAPENTTALIDLLKTGKLGLPGATTQYKKGGEGIGLYSVIITSFLCHKVAGQNFVRNEMYNIDLLEKDNVFALEVLLPTPPRQISNANSNVIIWDTDKIEIPNLPKGMTNAYCDDFGDFRSAVKNSPCYICVHTTDIGDNKDELMELYLASNATWFFFSGSVPPAILDICKDMGLSEAEYGSKWQVLNRIDFLYDFLLEYDQAPTVRYPYC